VRHEASDFVGALSYERTQDTPPTTDGIYHPRSFNTRRPTGATVWYGFLFYVSSRPGYQNSLAGRNWSSSAPTLRWIGPQYQPMGQPPCGDTRERERGDGQVEICLPLKVLQATKYHYSKAAGLLILSSRLLARCVISTLSQDRWQPKRRHASTKLTRIGRS